MIYIGIDPGLSGAVAAISDEGFVGVWDTPTLVVETGKSKRRRYQVAAMVRLLSDRTRKDPRRISAVGLEQVSAMPGQGVTSMFSLGYGFGLWHGIIAALELPVHLVAPNKWKRAMNLTKDKARSILVAQELFPAAAEHLTRKKDHGRAEALLLAEYARINSTTKG